MQIALQILEFAGVAALATLAICAFFIFEYYHHKHKMRQAEHDKERGDVQFQRMKTQALQVAVSNGANYEVGADGSLRVIHRFPPTSASHNNVKITEEAPQEQKLLPPPPLLLPGPCDFADILETWRPDTQHILLGIAPGGQHVTVPLKALCHVALAGATGGGKSALMRLLLSQLLFVGTQVILADPHYAPVDPESGEDWRSIAARLAMPPSVSYASIKDTLNWMAYSELPKRLALRRKSEHPGVPYFLAIDELPAIVREIDEAPEYMAKLLMEGRKVGLYLVSAAQDWLVKSIGGTGGVRDCFRTAFYVGGDATSARVLLDVKGKVDDGGLGKGIVMLRSMATPQAALSRIPYASNEALQELLAISAPATFAANVPASTPSSRYTGPLQKSPSAVDTDPQIMVESQLDARTLRIRDMVRNKIPASKIIEEVWGISAKAGGGAYMKAARELTDIMSSLLGGS